MPDGDHFCGWRERAVLGAVNDANGFHAYGGVAGHAGLFSDLAEMIRFAVVFADPEAHAASWRPTWWPSSSPRARDVSQALGFRRYPIELAGRFLRRRGRLRLRRAARRRVGPGRRVSVAMASNR